MRNSPESQEEIYCEFSMTLKSEQQQKVFAGCKWRYFLNGVCIDTTLNETTCPVARASRGEISQEEYNQESLRIQRANRFRVLEHPNFLDHYQKPPQE